MHFHWPNLIKDMLRWTLFCAATKREQKLNMDWQPFFDVAKKVTLVGFFALIRPGSTMQLSAALAFCICSSIHRYPSIVRRVSVCSFITRITPHTRW